MNEPLIDTIEQLASQSVQDVFQEMFAITMDRAEPVPLAADSSGQIAGSVGFIGQVNGIVHLYTKVNFARVIAGKMLGLTEAEVESEAMINDALGELSNVVVGKVKSNLCDGGLSCTLTLPSIVRGQQLSVGETSNAAYRILGFCNCEHRMLVEVVVQENQP